MNNAVFELVTAQLLGALSTPAAIVVIFWLTEAVKAIDRQWLPERRKSGDRRATTHGRLRPIYPLVPIVIGIGFFWVFDYLLATDGRDMRAVLLAGLLHGAATGTLFKFIGKPILDRVKRNKRRTSGG